MARTTKTARIRWPIGSEEARAKAVLALQGKTQTQLAPEQPHKMYQKANAQTKVQTKIRIQPILERTHTMGLKSKARTNTQPKSPKPPTPQLTPDASTLSPSPPKDSPKRKSNSTLWSSMRSKRPKTSEEEPRKPEEDTSDPFDVSNVEIPPEDINEMGEVRVYDTVNTIQQKIITHLNLGVAQVSGTLFAYDILAAAYGPNTERRIEPGLMAAFLGHKGPVMPVENNGEIYYAAYVYFEKLRIKKGEPKSEDRLRIKETHPHGLDTKMTLDLSL